MAQNAQMLIKSMKNHTFGPAQGRPKIEYFDLPEERRVQLLGLQNRSKNGSPSSPKWGPWAPKMTSEIHQKRSPKGGSGQGLFRTPFQSFFIDFISIWAFSATLKKMPTRLPKGPRKRNSKGSSKNLSKRVPKIDLEITIFIQKGVLWGRPWAAFSRF